MQSAVEETSHAISEVTHDPDTDETQLIAAEKKDATERHLKSLQFQCRQQQLKIQEQGVTQGSQISQAKIYTVVANEIKSEKSLETVQIGRYRIPKPRTVLQHTEQRYMHRQLSWYFVDRTLFSTPRLLTYTAWFMAGTRFFKVTCTLSNQKAPLPTTYHITY